MATLYVNRSAVQDIALLAAKRANPKVRTVAIDAVAAPWTTLDGAQQGLTVAQAKALLSKADPIGGTKADRDARIGAAFTSYFGTPTPAASHTFASAASQLGVKEPAVAKLVKSQRRNLMYAKVAGRFEPVIPVGPGPTALADAFQGARSISAREPRSTKQKLAITGYAAASATLLTVGFGGLFLADMAERAEAAGRPDGSLGPPPGERVEMQPQDFEPVMNGEPVSSDAFIAHNQALTLDNSTAKGQRWIAIDKALQQAEHPVLDVQDGVLAPEVAMFISATSGAPADVNRAWSSDFVTWAYQGVKNIGFGGGGALDPASLMDWATQSGALRDKTKYEAQLGDIVALDLHEGSPGADSFGLVVGYREQTGELLLVEGDVPSTKHPDLGQVRRVIRNVTDATVVAVIDPTAAQPI